MILDVFIQALNDMSADNLKRALEKRDVSSVKISYNKTGESSINLYISVTIPKKYMMYEKDIYEAALDWAFVLSGFDFKTYVKRKMNIVYMPQSDCELIDVQRRLDMDIGYEIMPENIDNILYFANAYMYLITSTGIAKTERK